MSAERPVENISKGYSEYVVTSNKLNLNAFLKNILIVFQSFILEKAINI